MILPPWLNLPPSYLHNVLKYTGFFWRLPLNIISLIRYYEVFTQLTSLNIISLIRFTNTSLAAKGALANRLQRHTAFKIQNGRQGAQTSPMGSGKVFGRSKQLSLNKSFDPSIPSMRKVDGEKKKKKKNAAFSGP